MLIDRTELAREGPLGVIDLLDAEDDDRANEGGRDARRARAAESRGWCLEERVTLDKTLCVEAREELERTVETDETERAEATEDEERTEETDDTERMEEIDAIERMEGVRMKEVPLEESWRVGRRGDNGRLGDSCTVRWLEDDEASEEDGDVDRTTSGGAAEREYRGSAIKSDCTDSTRHERARLRAMTSSAAYRGVGVGVDP